VTDLGTLPGSSYSAAIDVDDLGMILGGAMEPGGFQNRRGWAA
jgi:hypothetical protein